MRVCCSKTADRPKKIFVMIFESYAVLLLSLVLQLQDAKMMFAKQFGNSKTKKIKKKGGDKYTKVPKRTSGSPQQSKLHRASAMFVEVSEQHENKTKQFKQQASRNRSKILLTKRFESAGSCSCNCPKVIIRSQIIPCFLGLITASTDLDLIN